MSSVDKSEGLGNSQTDPQSDETSKSDQASEKNMKQNEIDGNISTEDESKSTSESKSVSSNKRQCCILQNKDCFIRTALLGCSGSEKQPAKFPSAKPSSSSKTANIGNEEEGTLTSLIYAQIRRDIMKNDYQLLSHLEQEMRVRRRVVTSHTANAIIAAHIPSGFQPLWKSLPPLPPRLEELIVKAHTYAHSTSGGTGSNPLNTQDSGKGSQPTGPSTVL
jgi:hypothetical protein